MIVQEEMTSFEIGLVSRAKSRDTEAFAELYARHSQRVFRHVYYIVGQNRHEADDLTTETFLKAWTSFERFELRGRPILNWLLVIGHNLAIKSLKARRPQVPLNELVLEDPKWSPEGVCERRDETRLVRQAVLALPNIQRQVIVWRFFENMSYEDVEAMLGKSQGAIRVIQYRALKNLKSILDKAASRRDNQSTTLQTNKALISRRPNGTTVSIK